jgi:hypothetical protein
MTTLQPINKEIFTYMIKITWFRNRLIVRTPTNSIYGLIHDSELGFSIAVINPDNN